MSRPAECGIGRRVRPLRLLVVLICLASCARTISAAEPRIARFTDLRIGFQGYYKVGYWTPVLATVEAGDEPIAGCVELIVPDDEGAGCRVVSDPIHLAAGKTTPVRLLAKIGLAQGEVRLALREEEQVAAQRTFDLGEVCAGRALDGAAELIVSVGPVLDSKPGGRNTRGKDSQLKLVQLEDCSELPAEWAGYDGVDWLVLSTSEAEVYRSLNTADPRLVAIDQWLRLGGRLVLCAGRNANEVLAEGSPLTRFAPGKLDGNSPSLPLRQAAAIETYAETSDKLEAEPGPARFRIEVPKLVNVRGKIEAFEGSRFTDLPLVVRTPHGFGEVVFVGLDLDRPPLAAWAGREPLLDKLLGRRKQPAEGADGPSAGTLAANLGYSDLGGQLRGALDQFAGVALVPFALVAVLVVAYILCIGPLDYWFLKKIVRRMELTWITFPAVVLAFCIAAYVLAYRLKGREVRVNQIDVVDFDQEFALSRGTSWLSVFSPQIDSYNLSVRPLTGDKPRDSGLLLSWLGLPGNPFAAEAASAAAAGAVYENTPRGELRNLPISVWSAKSIGARWNASGESPLQADLIETSDQLLSGKISSKLAEPLTDCVLLYDRWSYSLGPIAPGQLVQVDGRFDPQTIDTYFRRQNSSDPADINKPYNLNRLSIESVVPIMMFHEAAGGERFTRLTNRSQSLLDASGLLRMGRAVLFGRSAKPAAQLLRDGEPLAGLQDQHWTWYRFVFPVRPATAQ